MNLNNLFKIAYRTLNRNKLRSFLTMLGIIIGVASVIAMLAIGEGSRSNILAQIASMGTNAMIIFPSAGNQGGVRMEAGTSQGIKEEDVTAIKERCKAVKYASPLVRASVQAVASSENWRTSVMGVYIEYFNIRNLDVVDGNCFSVSDEKSSNKVCVIGQTVVSSLFGEENNPVGQIIRINKIPFKVIGVLEKKGQNLFGQDQDDVILAPFSTVQKRILAVTNIHQILISAQSENDIHEATIEITEVLREKHKLSDYDEDDFTIRTQSELGDMFSATTKIMSILLASIASISLLVGGIGIMNIMLVSVTERTREIGIRMAVGAKGKDILLQFLIEAILLSLLGGLIGVGLGVFISQLVANLAGWPVTVTTNSVLLSFVFSAMVGIFFGWYPARKAAKMNPIEALRYE